MHSRVGYRILDPGPLRIENQNQGRRGGTSDAERRCRTSRSTIGDDLSARASLHGDSEVVTFEGDGCREATFAEVADRAERLAGSAAPARDRSPAIASAPSCWNIQEHLEAYFAVPCMGAVLHTLNIRLFPEQLTYIVNHADDRVIIVDDNLVPLLAGVAADLRDRRALHRRRRRRRLGARRPPATPVLRYEDLLAAESLRLRLARASTNAPRRRCATRAAPPATRRASSTRTARRCCTRSAPAPGRRSAVHERRPRPADRADVPRQRVGRSRTRLDGRRRPHHARPLPAGRAALPHDRRSERPTCTGAVPTIWTDLLRYAENHDVDFSSLQRVMCGGCGGAARADGGVPGPLRRPHAPGLGHDRDQPARRGRATRRGASPRGRGDGLARADRPHRARRRAAHRRRRRRGAAVGRRGGRRDRGARPVDHRLATTATPRPRSSTTAGCAPATSPASRRTATSRSPTAPKDVIKSGGEWISSVELEGLLMAHPDVARGRGHRRARPALGRAPARLRRAAPRARAPVPTSSASSSPSHVAQLAAPERWTFIDEVPKTSVGKFDKKVLRARYADGELEVVELDAGAGSQAAS